MTSRLVKVVLAVALLAALACEAGSGTEPARVRGADLELRVSVDPAAPRVGENRLRIEVRDPDGNPVSAEVSAAVRMHAMGAMPAMGGPLPVRETGAGRYEGEFELEMGGTWLVEVRAATTDGQRLTAEGSLTPGTPGLRLAAAGAAQPSALAGADGEHPAEFALPLERVQRIGVRTATAERRAVATTIRALGIVSYDESALEDVSLKVRGWVGELVVDAVGNPVEAGQVLFTLYSPELYAAQAEYLQALRSQERARGTSAPDRSDYLVRAARNRLRLWDVAPTELEQLSRRDTPIEYLPIRAPRSGYVLEKNVVEGSGVEPGQRLYRIAPLDRVWIEAEVYESEVGLVAAGQAASVELAYAPGVSHEAEVAYVLPSLSREARTARVRLELANPQLALRPDMYVNVRIPVERGERVVVPPSAVLHAGERSFVFLVIGEGRFRPQAVEVGLASGDWVEIRSGLEAGAPVVSSATFLIASESRLRAALEQW